MTVIPVAAVYARRLDWRANQEIAAELVDRLAEHCPCGDPEQTKDTYAAAIMESPALWTMHDDSRVVGVFALTKINGPSVHAVFTVLDGNWVGKRKLLRNLISLCFSHFGFQRMALEVPEDSKIQRFARRALGFKYEGELRPRNPELPAGLTDDWVAKQGSRTERAYWDGTDWKDVVRLRVFASDYIAEEAK